uniref:NADH-ubiquinone oxidoreductase chain 2 n=1 Tax=Japananus hyalinus TaxID=1256066 RepID=A0A343BSW6_9HEMI|nr:NADH dehydrogenase subunit 2 [Japananus hyalinus]ARA90987.1 NADH dehydrogenase subunit 2 [Japananus hyalinus]
MYFNSTKLMLANTMMIGVIMTICSNNWMSMWMGLEISLISFIPLMQNNLNSSSESMIKYFIMQSVSSTMFLFSVTIMLIGVNMMEEFMLSLSMLIKLGSTPFHNWIIMTIENLSMMTMLNMLTILKIPPLMIMYQIESDWILIPIMLGMIISPIQCLNQSSIRKTLGFSSIFNISLTLLIIDKMLTMLMFMLIYSLNMILLTMVFNSLKIKYFNQIMLNESSNWNKINVWINLLSMGGFPPLMGFMNKILVLQNLLMNSQLTIMFIMLLSSMLVLMFYTRMAFSVIMMNSLFKKWMTINNSKYLYFQMTLNFTMTGMIMVISMIN